MPLTFAGGRRSGGASLRLGPATNTFMGATETAAEGERDTYAAANAAWLAAYDADSTLLIRLEYGATIAYQSRAGGVWLDNTHLVTGPPGPGLPVGSSVLSEIRWDASAGDWAAVSTVQTVYYAMTREATFASLSAALLSFLAQGGSSYYDAALGAHAAVRGSYATWAADTLDTAWPAGEAPPTVWTVSPRYYGWLEDFSFRTTAQNPGQPADALINGVYARATFDVFINGTRYEVGYAALPQPARKPFNISWRYSAPAATAPVVSETTPP